MLFNSLPFALFLAVVLLLYHLLPHRAQNRMLLAAGYAFYSAWDYRFLGLILLSTTVDFFCGLRINSARTERERRLFLILSIAFNLTLLGIFKYFNFFAEGFHSLLALVGLPSSLPALKIILPVGISFYTFQEMAYTIEVYRRTLLPCRNFLDYAVYVNFFPQLAAGPIERPGHLLGQILRPRTVTPDQVGEGAFLLVWGLTKKILIADNLSPAVNALFAKSAGFAPGEVLIGTALFAAQIYCDFSSYSDMARGMAKLMGFELMVNFRLPYFARNPSDFWRRWHISLSTWLRDYLYIPLGGNRLGRARTHINLLVTMLLGGLWHGAAWNFVFWGLYHGTLLAGHRALSEEAGLGLRLERIVGKIAFHVFSVALMLVLTLYGWMLFRAQGLSQIVEMTRHFLDIGWSPEFADGFKKLAVFAGPLLLVQLAQNASGDLMFIYNRGRIPAAVFLLACCYASALFGNFNGPAFIYFQF